MACVRAGAPKVRYDDHQHGVARPSDRSRSRSPPSPPTSDFTPTSQRNRDPTGVEVDLHPGDDVPGDQLQVTVAHDHSIRYLLDLAGRYWQIDPWLLFIETQEGRHLPTTMRVRDLPGHTLRVQYIEERYELLPELQRNLIRGVYDRVSYLAAAVARVRDEVGLHPDQTLQDITAVSWDRSVFGCRPTLLSSFRAAQIGSYGRIY